MLTQVIIIVCASPFYRLKKLKAALIFGKHFIRLGLIYNSNGA